MKKVLRRTALAKAQAERRTTKAAEKNAALSRKIQKQEHGAVLAAIHQDVRNARLVRRERRELGPLAPRWDVGDRKNTYGTMDSRRLNGPEKPPEQRTMVWNIVPGDRVVLVAGRDKGKIGEVKTIDKKRDELTVKGANLVDIAIPDWMHKTSDDPDKRPFRTVESAVPLEAVRLVHALVDPETGTKRDVIVNKLVNSHVWHDKQLGTRRWTRFIAGLNVRVPWPQRPAKERKDHDADTLRIDVEQRTWVPTLLRPPMPGSVIDELRNKYSRFRDRHDDDYVRLKEEEDRVAAGRSRGVGSEMRTPLMEAKARERSEKRKLGRPRLTEEMLVTIGEVMARSRRGVGRVAAPEKVEGAPS